jgi:hypothetical protein
MVHVSRGNTLVMEAGSKLTNYTYTKTANYFFYSNTAVTVQGGVFELRGGEISNIKIHNQTGNIVLCEQSGFAPASQFIYYDGVFSGNTGGQIAVGSYFDPIFYDVSDPLFQPVP